jgi:2-polyprenyl-3-methyl-5-hydroxy-6-metoxy-1,4-benzoquinol methylase
MLTDVTVGEQPSPGGEVSALTMKRMTVLYVAGYTRSGSTLLSRMIGSLPGFLAVGEAAAHFFRFTQSIDAPCGCGLSVDSCPFWKDVNFPAKTDASYARLFRFRNLVLLESYRRRHPRESQELIDSMTLLFRTIAEKTSARVIVDSSKTPLHAQFLSWIPEIDLHVIQLVRDPRGVASSYRSPKHYLPMISPFRVTAGWIGLNLGCEYLQGRVPHFWRLRYEDFVRAPQLYTAQIASDLGYRGDTSALFSDQSTVLLQPQHMLGGNPDKLDGESVKIKPRPIQLSRATRVLVSAVSAPLLWRYRYRPMQQSAVANGRNSHAADGSRGDFNLSATEDVVAVSFKDKPSGYFSCPRSELIPLVPAAASRILEIGCGEGRLAQALRGSRPASDLEIVGVELCDAPAKTAATILNRVMVGNVEQMDLPYEDYFDCVIFADVLEHLVDPWRMLRRARKLLRRDGVIVASIPNVQHSRVLINLLLGRFDYEQAGIMDSTHLRFFTRKSIITLFQSTGYELRRLSVILGSKRVRLAHLVTAGLVDSFLTRQYLVVANAKAGDAGLFRAGDSPAV